MKASGVNQSLPCLFYPCGDLLHQNAVAPGDGSTSKRRCVVKASTSRRPSRHSGCEKVVGTAKGLQSTLQSGRLSNSYISNSNSIKFEIAHRISTFCPFCFFLGGWCLAIDGSQRYKIPMLAALPQHLWLHLCSCWSTSSAVNLHCDAQALGAASGRPPSLDRSRTWSFTRRTGIKSISKDQLYPNIYIHDDLIYTKKNSCLCVFIYIYLQMYIKNLSRPWQVHFMKKLLPSGKSGKPCPKTEYNKRVVCIIYKIWLQRRIY